MKKSYSTPILSSYGAVEELTQALGRGQESDFFYLNGNPLAAGDTYGSRDLDVTVKERPRN
jgi:hypothetical protein